MKKKERILMELEKKRRLSRGEKKIFDELKSKINVVPNNLVAKEIFIEPSIGDLDAKLRYIGQKSIFRPRGKKS